MTGIQFAAAEDAEEIIRELGAEGYQTALVQESADLWRLDVEPWDERVIEMVDVYGGWLPGDVHLA